MTSIAQRRAYRRIKTFEARENLALFHILGRLTMDFNEIIEARGFGEMVNPEAEDIGTDEIRHCGCGVKLSRYNHSNSCHACKERQKVVDSIDGLNELTLRELFS